MANGYGQPVGQSTHLVNQSPYMNHMHNVLTQTEQLSTSRTDPSAMEIFIQQQAIQRDANAIISKFSELETQYKNNHFLADVHTYDGKGDRSFLDWITQVEMISKLTLCQEI